MERRVGQLSRRIGRLEQELSAQKETILKLEHRLSNNPLLHRNLIIRALAVLGHYLLAAFLLGIILVVATILVSLFAGNLI